MELQVACQYVGVDTARLAAGLIREVMGKTFFKTLTAGNGKNTYTYIGALAGHGKHFGPSCSHPRLAMIVTKT